MSQLHCCVRIIWELQSWDSANWLSAAVSPPLHGKWTGWCVNLLSVEIRKACRICLNYLKQMLQRKIEINQGSETETLLWNKRYNFILKATLYWDCLPKEGSNPLLKPSHAQAKQEQCLFFSPMKIQHICLWATLWKQPFWFWSIWHWFLRPTFSATKCHNSKCKQLV